LYRRALARTRSSTAALAGRALLATTVLGAGAGCASLSSVNLFAPQDDVQLGRQAYQEVLANERVLTSGQEVQQVERVTARLVEAVKIEEPELGELFEWEVRVIDAPETANAFCLPGGKMAVYTGILPVAKSDAGLAVVMGHEIAHATRRHGTAAMTRAVGFQTLIEYALNGPVTQSLAGIGSQLAQLQFGQSAELEADREGVMYLARAGYDPREAVEFWSRMAQLSGGDEPSWLEGFLSTHPSNQKRIDQLQDLMPEALAVYEESRGGGGAQPGTRKVRQ
jgi:predicted Zn-dependent protease